MASAMGMAWILEFLGVEDIGIYYCGDFGRRMNRAMQVTLNIPMKKWTPELQKEFSLVPLQGGHNTYAVSHGES